MIIGISGMISSGKSTLTTQLSQYYKGSRQLFEFDETDEVFNTFLKWFYEQKENLTIGFQTYIIEAHSSKFAKLLAEHKEQKTHAEHIFLDRFSLEHYIFAQVNLGSKEPKYLRAYDLAFRELIGPEELPDFAIFLDMSFATFEERFMKRGRAVEIDNWELNKNYFFTLYSCYKDVFLKLCDEYKLDYVIIDTNGKDEKQVLFEVINIIDQKTSQSKNPK